MTEFLENLNVIATLAAGIVVWAFTAGAGWVKMKGMITTVAAKMGAGIASNVQSIKDVKETVNKMEAGWRRDREERKRDDEERKKWIIGLQKLLSEHDGDIRVLQERTGGKSL